MLVETLALMQSPLRTGRAVGRTMIRPAAVATIAAAVLGGGIPITSAVAQPARSGSFSGSYALTLAGVSIGAARLSASIAPGGAYSLDMHAKLTGLAGVLVSGKGGARSSGVINNGRVIPAAIAVLASTADDKRSMRMAFSGGAVSAIEIKPPLEDWDRPDRIQVAAAHRQSVIDPLSALLMPASAANLADACSRTIPVFDGATRFDIVLSHVKTITLDKAGYSGPAVVCAARYIPVSGHRPNRSMTRFMIENRDMGVTLIPIGDSGVYAPYSVHVRTTMGMSMLQAVRLRVDAGAAIATNTDTKGR